MVNGHQPSSLTSPLFSTTIDMADEDDNNPDPDTKTKEVRVQLQDKGESADDFTRKKTFAKGFIDVALISANVSQLKTVVITGHASKLFVPLTLLLSISLLLQITLSLLSAYAYRVNLFNGPSTSVDRKESKEWKEEKMAWKKGYDTRARVRKINDWVLYATIVLVFLNVAISGIGIDLEKA